MREKIKTHLGFLLKIYRILRKVLLTIIWYPKLIKYKYENKKNKNIIFCECFVFYSFFGKFKHNNWGDDINKFFMEYITGKKFIFIPYSETFIKPKETHYSLIGSIIGNYNLNNTVIYGSGMIKKDKIIEGTPKKIISVRGPLTQKALEKKGIACPKCFGDPVILLPIFYTPKKIYSSNKIGIIPNVGTGVNNIVNDLLKNENTVIIDTTKYNEWTDIVDQIVSCDFIISESLHGLIVAETYNVPSIWVEFKEHKSEWNFKFNDFYESVGKLNQNSIKLYNIDYDFNHLLTYKMKWTQSDIDYNKQFKYFPFKIRKELIINTSLLD